MGSGDQKDGETSALLCRKPIADGEVVLTSRWRKVDKAKNCEGMDLG